MHYLKIINILHEKSMKSSIEISANSVQIKENADVLARLSTRLKQAVDQFKV